MIKAMHTFTLALLCAALVACGGDNSAAQSSTQLDDKPDPRPIILPDDGIACDTVYEPVCSVELQNIQCITTPCPIGVHKTFGNQCESDAAKARFLSKGECGELEGQPYYDEKPDDDAPIACTKEYNPVCAAETSTEPCTTLPCPVMHHKTFGNPCMARAAKARIVQQGECGKLEDTPVTQFEGACPAVHDPVCGKAPAGIACITQPCPTHSYQTFGNSCEAGLARAAVVLDEECGKLEGTIAFAEPPVTIVEKLPAVEKEVKVDNVRFEGDRLFVTLGYSGCAEQHFDLQLSSIFMESNPVQAETVFVPAVNDRCLAYFTTEFAYDLIPLKHAHQQGYHQEHAEIILRGIGRYRF
jgi:hypothetical protein